MDHLVVFRFFLPSSPNPLKLDLLSLWHLSVLYVSLGICTCDASIITQIYGRSSTALCCSLNALISFDFSGFSEFILGLYRFSPSHYLPLQWAVILYCLNMVLGCWLRRLCQITIIANWHTYWPRLVSSLPILYIRLHQNFGSRLIVSP